MLRASIALLILTLSALACERSQRQSAEKVASAAPNKVDQLPQLASDAPVDQIVHGHDPAQDPAMQRLIAEATAELDDVRQRFLTGLPPGHHLFVTTILRNGQDAEQVFVSVQDWSNPDLVGGLLATPPAAIKSRAGDVLKIPRSAIIDWTIARPDGSEEGNRLGKYLDSASQSPRGLRKCEHPQESPYHHGIKPTSPGCAKFWHDVVDRSPNGLVDRRSDEFELFLQELQRALKAVDKEAVANLVRFPDLGITRAEFLAHYDEIITPCVREAVGCVTMDNVGENYLGINLGWGSILAYGSPGCDEPAFYIIGFQGRCRDDNL